MCASVYGVCVCRVHVLYTVCMWCGVMCMLDDVYGIYMVCSV